MYQIEYCVLFTSSFDNLDATMIIDVTLLFMKLKRGNMRTPIGPSISLYAIPRGCKQAEDKRARSVCIRIAY